MLTGCFQLQKQPDQTDGPGVLVLLVTWRWEIIWHCALQMLGHCMGTVFAPAPPRGMSVYSLYGSWRPQVDLKSNRLHGKPGALATKSSELESGVVHHAVGKHQAPDQSSRLWQPGRTKHRLKKTSPYYVSHSSTPSKKQRQCLFVCKEMKKKAISKVPDHLKHIQ